MSAPVYNIRDLRRLSIPLAATMTALAQRAGNVLRGRPLTAQDLEQITAKMAGSLLVMSFRFAWHLTEPADVSNLASNAGVMRLVSAYRHDDFSAEVWAQRAYSRISPDAVPLATFHFHPEAAAQFLQLGAMCVEIDWPNHMSDADPLRWVRDYAFDEGSKLRLDRALEDRG